MPELSAAPADAAVTAADRLLNTDFEYITVQQVADANESKASNISSAATTDIGAATAPFVHVTGTTTITGLGTVQAGTRRIVVFDGILTLTHNASSLILPTAANITTAAGDTAVFVSEGSGNWRCVEYQRADGTALAGGVGSGDVVGPASAVADRIATFDGTTGKLIKDGGTAIASLAPLASPTFTGTPAAPTASLGTDTTQIATTAHVKAAVSTIQQNSQSAAYTLVLADAGKHILHPSADTTARVFTIPANSSVAFPVGTVVTFVNQNAGGVITIAITTDTMRLADAGTTGSRTLAANGIATAIKITSTEWLINGAGLT